VKKLNAGAWLGGNLILGGLPSLAFFIWLERNAALPFIAIELEWPWWQVRSSSLFVLLFFNATLLSVFGFFHSFLALPKIKDKLNRWIPEKALRSFYLISTGLLLFGIMAFWQNTGQVVWLLPLSYWSLQAVSLTLFWTLLFFALIALYPLGITRFLGWHELFGILRDTQKQESSLQGSSPLEENNLYRAGFYRYMRHPNYFFLLSALLLTPMMSLDRLLVFLVFLIYILMAIPLEEKKLKAQFKAEYEEYRTQVPSLWPRSLLPRFFRQSR
jgi:methanethiol S-methyltransferase